ncbi:Fe-S protein assembly co-chaperone HscB [Laribacter hongkongensis]|uniref:Fe-S protein assembly co-chaperone HscB n=1 Tax=Laribacter hongkongensis TaxID=168471 RepID=UPI001EFE310A|nr:Fe-S protein assembly co-chaperone HscB [Laribacter hongkongensis]MCG8993627.1 Fe-S protein assembly co-chaperone HscB [Laribacter hongkongensis]MCG8998287.1 Fe-S protein assembly co-chaperone HscB [Laribacter hongkongensis]MCG9001588.1 Fe-S protein assembly co-chaperone HscB [Laribacter hongkongensis]MCG9005797.1 Fe-S protein assembly co-chaperone HscB [Laribacter hongkongensis]MCG9008886.1 Fe-S protein assembly co-chaperone HscB [Laribacter hongkongensis]
MSYFELFDLPVRFAVDGEALETAYRKVQAEVHPDRFASAPEAERRRALELATEANEAFQTLRSPVARARYLLQLRGIDTQEETNTAMPVDFLMAQMEWREAVVDARAASDVEGLEQLAAAVRADRDELVAALVRSLDVTQEYDVAALGVRKLRFLDKLDQEIGDAIESLLF